MENMPFINHQMPTVDYLALRETDYTEETQYRDYVNNIIYNVILM